MLVIYLCAGTCSKAHPSTCLLLFRPEGPYKERNGIEVEVRIRSGLGLFRERDFVDLPVQVIVFFVMMKQLALFVRLMYYLFD